jgi:serine/threonine protein kinase
VRSSPQPTAFIYEEREYPVVVDANLPISEVAKAVSKAVGAGIAPESLVIAFRGSRLDQDMTLADLELDPMDRLQVEVNKPPPRQEDRPLSEWIKDFSRMKVVRRLGEDAFGVVDLVKDSTNHELIALKSLHAKLSDGCDISEKFMREVEALIAVVHPCVVSIVGYWLPTRLAPGQIGTAFAAGGSMRAAIDLWEQGRAPAFIDDTGVAIIASGIVLGMWFAHLRGFLHRDLKPENILIDSEGRVRICDLGSARFADLDLNLTKQIGTPLYMAPEM